MAVTVPEPAPEQVIDVRPGDRVATIEVQGCAPTALPELERQVIVLRFFHDMDQYAIATKVGYSQMHISRLLRRALARMRTQLVEP